ncbi:uncharacterized protein LOC111619871 isoform X2 [Centruroides sculpturatus]|uniref:uncharacterized protein LOC111619871 isoform X2 n=1 Tax=Centruroides sculpturatus TaxID=218467 RepID=UPI000C6D3B84|nr:uncharacterized protein LOC111619871 isoform X2 [Centruroides sculpturatus]
MGLINSKKHQTSIGNSLIWRNYVSTEKSIVHSTCSFDDVREDKFKKNWKLIKMIETKIFTLQHPKDDSFECLDSESEKSYPKWKNTKYCHWKEIGSADIRDSAYYPEKDIRKQEYIRCEVKRKNKKHSKTNVRYEPTDKGRQCDRYSAFLYKKPRRSKSKNMNRTDYVEKYIARTKKPFKNEDEDCSTARLSPDSLVIPKFHDSPSSKPGANPILRKNRESRIEVTPSLIQNGNSLFFDGKFVKKPGRKSKLSKSLEQLSRKDDIVTSVDSVEQTLPKTTNVKKLPSEDDDREVLDASATKVKFPAGVTYKTKMNI